MDYLREGIGLRAMAQRDPLVEYQREGYDMFKAMMEAIREESVGYIFNVEVQVDENAGAAEELSPNGDADHPHILAKGLEAPERPSELTFSAPSADGDEEIHVERADGAGDGAAAGGGKQNRAERRAQKKGRR